MQVPGQSTRPARSPRILEFPRLVPPSSRLLVPREHGSWGLWLLPLISGAIVGCVFDPLAAAEPVFWFGVAAASGFLIYQPMEILLGLSLVKARSQRQQRTALLWIIVFTIAGACSVLELLYLQRFLVLLIGAVALGCFGVRSLFGRSRRVRVLKQLIGALGLTSTVAGAYYAATGRMDRTALLLWLASWLFAAGQIEYVQLRLRSAQVRSSWQKARSSLAVSIFHFLVLAITIAAGLAHVAPFFLGLTFIPAVIRLAVWVVLPWRPLRVHILGISELVQGVLFNALLVTAFLVHH
ncbi:MAG TPA: YwiC-like family protein [Candidatus Angelobacter sp.]|nr:YwiC-like family protein [Candidatus Angelobacter sp.]